MLPEPNEPAAQELAALERQKSKKESELAALENRIRQLRGEPDRSPSSLAHFRFGDWVKIGFAVTLPLLALGVLLLLLLLIWSQKYTPHIGPR